MSATVSTDFLLRVAQATPEQQAAIERILVGEARSGTAFADATAREGEALVRIERKVGAADSRQIFFQEMLRRFDIKPSSYAGRPVEEWSTFFDPLTDAKAAPQTVRRYILPYLFY